MLAQSGRFDQLTVIRLSFSILCFFVGGAMRWMRSLMPTTLHPCKCNTCRAQSKQGKRERRAVHGVWEAGHAHLTSAQCCTVTLRPSTLTTAARPARPPLAIPLSFLLSLCSSLPLPPGPFFSGIANWLLGALT